jgi:hypothetical protein
MLYPIVETQRSLLKPLAMWAAGASASSGRFISAAIQSRSRCTSSSNCSQYHSGTTDITRYPSDLA